MVRQRLSKRKCGLAGLLRKRLAFKVMGAIVTIVSLFSTREPTFALPDVAFTLCFINHSHPPIEADENSDTNAPFDEDPNNINPAK